MTTTEQNPAREEFFDQLQQLHVKWFEAPNEEDEHPLKEEILSITYDANVALQKRVEELEEALKLSTEFMNEIVHRVSPLQREIVREFLEKNQQLLTK